MAEDNIIALKGALLRARCDHRFQLIWEATLEASKQLGVDEPIQPRQRKVPKRLQHGNAAHYFPEDPSTRYRQLFFQAFDAVIAGLDSRFEPTETSQHLSAVERFIVGNEDKSYVQVKKKKKFKIIYLNFFFNLK